MPSHPPIIFPHFCTDLHLKVTTQEWVINSPAVVLLIHPFVLSSWVGAPTPATQIPRITGSLATTKQWTKTWSRELAACVSDWKSKGYADKMWVDASWCLFAAGPKRKRSSRYPVPRRFRHSFRTRGVRRVSWSYRHTPSPTNTMHALYTERESCQLQRTTLQPLHALETYVPSQPQWYIHSPGTSGNVMSFTGTFIFDKSG